MLWGGPLALFYEYDGVAAAALGKYTVSTLGKGSLARLLVLKAPILAFCGRVLRDLCVKSYCRSARLFDGPCFTQQTGGLTWGITLRKMQHAQVNRGRLSGEFIGQSRAINRPLRRILRTCQENTAYNTLPYNFVRMLLLPL